MTRAVHWTLDRADALVALVAGLVVGVGGVVGFIKGNDLAAATLLVLSVVALALLRERSRRLEAPEKLDALEAAVRALHSRGAYHITDDRCHLDLVAQDGGLAHLHRLKRICFDQNEVIALRDWAEGDGTADPPAYTGAVKVDDFGAEGRTYVLLSLRKFYSRGDKMDLGIRRTVHDAFPKQEERINVETLDTTLHLALSVAWPSGRPPKAVRQNHKSATGDRTSKNITDRVTTKDGRAFVEAEVEQPELGGMTTIEWDW